ncbi:MAG: two-component system sensor histidine kinase HydH [Myxococcota bacterium]|jgi:two-component system sensor histidine kinase HydH
MRWATSKLTVGALLVAITLAHLSTSTEHMLSHNVFRRLYYLPIILAAFGGGRLRGGLAALAAAALYIPHAFLMHQHMDPAPPGDKVLEILLFILVGVLTGLLVERERKASSLRREAEERADRYESLVRSTRGLAQSVQQPLTTIGANLEKLRPEFPAGHRKHRILNIGIKETARLERVVGDFTEFARPGDLHLKPVDIAALVDEVAQATRLAHPDVPLKVSTTPLVVTADRDQLTQCLLNLTLNAVQWSPPATPVTITLKGGRRPELQVEDCGPGVPEDDRERIFDPYFTTRDGGTGLGLPTAARIAHAHGATLRYEPRTPTGACLRLTFSTAQAAPPSQEC